MSLAFWDLLTENLPGELLSSIAQHISVPTLLDYSKQKISSLAASQTSSPQSKVAIPLSSIGSMIDWKCKTWHVEKLSELERLFHNIESIPKATFFSWRQIRCIAMDQDVGASTLLLLNWIQSFDLLHSVSFCSIDGMTDEVVEKLVKLHGKSLCRLRLERCLNLTNMSLYHIGQYCKTLSSLDISRSMFSEHGLSYLAGFTCKSEFEIESFDSVPTPSTITCPLQHSLRSLNLSKCLLIEFPESSQAIGQFKNLEELNLSHIESFTIQDAQMLLSSLGKMRLLKIEECLDFTQKSIADIANIYSKVKIVHNAYIKDDTSEAVREYLLSILNIR